jgi:CMP-N-acetylneuraminic acid synthetase
MSQPRVAAIVPMRHSSERVPGKNYRQLGGRPLYHHILSTLLETPSITSVTVDTDSEFIMTGLKEDFPEVGIVSRPEHLRGGEVPMNDVLGHDVTVIEADWYLQTHSTNPLLRAETIESALGQLLEAGDRFDSLFSVTRLQTRLWWDAGRPVNHDPAVLLRTQDLPPIYEENSNLYIFRKEVLLARGNRIGQHPLLFEIAREEAWDIDEELDFRVAELLYEKGNA